MSTSYRERNWNCLTDFKDWLTKSKKEKVLEFDGASLKTNKGVYGLFDNQLLFLEKK